jgi:hypothetical protein
LREVVGLDGVVLLVLNCAQHVEGNRLGRIRGDRGAEILFRRAEQVLDLPLIGDDSADDWTGAQGTAQLEGICVT